MSTVGDELPIELARVRKVKDVYVGLGPSVRIGAWLIDQDLEAADRAIASSDVTAMIRALQTLREIQF